VDVMTTSNEQILPTPQSTRIPLRLRLSPGHSAGSLDGAWWPQSRDLELEFGDLVDHFPSEVGRIYRGVYSPPDWDPSPRRVATARGYVKVGSFPRDDTHVMLLRLATRQELRVLVVPSNLESGRAAVIMREAIRGDSRRSALDILQSKESAVAAEQERDRDVIWHEDDSWWHPSEPPSKRA